MQVWQWLRHGVTLDDGQVLTVDRFGRVLEEEMTQLRTRLGPARFDRGHYKEAAKLFLEFSTSRRLAEFLTLAAYERLVQPTARL